MGSLYLCRVVDVDETGLLHWETIPTLPVHDRLNGVASDHLGHVSNSERKVKAFYETLQIDIRLKIRVRIRLQITQFFCDP